MTPEPAKPLLCRACMAKPARHDWCDGHARRLDEQGRWIVRPCECWCRAQGVLW